MNQFMIVIRDDRGLYNHLHVIIDTSESVESVVKYYSDKNVLDELIYENFDYDDGYFIVENILTVYEIPNVKFVV